MERAAKKRLEQRLAARERFSLMHKTEREIAASISIQRVRPRLFRIYLGKVLGDDHSHARDV